MKIELEIKDEFIAEVMLKYGDVKYEDVSKEVLENIRCGIIEGIVGVFEDEPHYFFDDYIEKHI